MILTPHFSLEEFKCHNGEPYPLDRPDDDFDGAIPWGKSRLYKLCLTLERIREEMGKPIRILSAWRPIEYNRKIGSSDGSQHAKGRAADIIVTDVSAFTLHAAIYQLYRVGKLPHLGGLGSYQRFVHIDVRPRPEDDHLARWNGGRANADG